MSAPQYPASVLHLHQEMSGNSLSLCWKGIRAQRFNDTLPSGGLAEVWRRSGFNDTLPNGGLAEVWPGSGGDFTARGVSTAENFNAMTSFFETYCTCIRHIYTYMYYVCGRQLI